MHLDDDQLLKLTLGQLDAETAAPLEAHVAGCDDCKRRQEGISSLVFSKTAVGSSDPGGNPTREDGGGPATGLVLARGATLGRYVLLEKLGAGGMGEVFAAYDPHLDRKVALKLLRGGTLSAEEGKARLLREAQAMARLQHPNVIAVHDVGTFGDRVFIAMEFVEGETLAEWLRGQRPWEQVVRVFTLAGEGLAAAHRAGLVHRDFKPENVLLGADLRPRVLDFGLARQATKTPPGDAPAPVEDVALGDATLARQLTRDGAVMGTPGYMPPEQIHGLPTDARSDQFSFCVAVWEGLFGKRPFGGGTLKQHADAIVQGKLAPLPSNTPVPDEVVKALKRGLAADPAQRWPDMAALLKALRPRAKRSVRTTLFVVGLVLFSALGIGYGVWTRQRLMVCGGAEKRLVGTWDLATKARLKAKFAASGLSYAPAAWASVERTVDLWAGEWVSASREACEAARLRGVDSPEVLELKEACLDEGVQRLKALVTLFEEPDRDVVSNAPTAAKQLDAPLACTTGVPQRRRVVDEKEKAADAQLQGKLAEARALFSAGKYGPGAERLKQGLSPAAPAGTQAEAYLWLSRLELKRGEPRQAHAAALLAAEQALKAGEEALVARALSRLYASEGFDQGDSDAEAWSRLAEAAAARVPGDWEVRVELLQNDGLVKLRRKQHKAALADFEDALTLQRERLGPEHPEVASTLNNLGVVLTHLDQPAEAVARYEESLALHEALEGPNHPNVALAANNLAVALANLGRAREAREASRRALSIRREALGAAHPETLRSVQQLATLEVGMQELESAGALVQELKEARTRSVGPDSAELLPVLLLEARLYLAGEYWPEALKVATQALALAKQLGASGERSVSTALLQKAIASTAQGNLADARKALDEVRRRQAQGDTGVDVALLAEAAARLEVAQGHGAEGVALLEEAITAREKSSLAKVRTLLLLGRVQRDRGEAEAALAAFEKAEAGAAAAQAERVLLDAQVQKAQALWLLKPEERGTAVELLMAAMEKLPEAQRGALTEWLRAHPAQGDAGVP